MSFCSETAIERVRIRWRPGDLAAIHLLTQLNKTDVRMDELENAIGQNVSLSYKLLRYINSTMCSLNRFAMRPFWSAWKGCARGRA